MRPPHHRRWFHGRLDRALAPHVVAALGLTLAIGSSLLAMLAPLVGDLRYAAAGRDASGDVVVVAIDPPSIRYVGTWPWPRSVHGSLIDTLGALGATDIALDVDLSSPSTPEQDTALAAALQQATATVILPVLQQPTSDGEVVTNRPLPSFAKTAWLASVNIRPDVDGRIRRYPMAQAIDGTVYPSFARQLVGGGTDVPEFHIDFGIRAETIPVISAADVLSGQVDRSQIAGRRVIVGGTALELGDRHAVPRDRVMAGPMIQAVAAETLHQGRALHPERGLITIVGLVVLALVYQLTRGSMVPCAIALVTAAIGGEAFALVLQRDFALLVDTTPWLAAAALYLMVGTVMALDVARLVARLSAHSFDVVAAGIRDGVLHLDADGKICFANGAAGDIFGVAAPRLVGTPLSALLTEGGDADGLMALAQGGEDFCEVEGRRASGLVALEASVSAWPAPSPYRFSVILRDVSERNAKAEQERRLARTDALTGLANRRALVEYLAELTTPPFAAAPAPFALLLFDLDGFKDVNDAFGHETGDGALVSFATTLAAQATPSDLAARLGGDEFALVLAGDGHGERLARITRDYRTLFSARYFQVGTRTLQLSSSMGSALYPQDGATTGEVLANADLALYAAKQSRARTQAFTRSLRQERDKVRAVQSELRRALDNDEFKLFYQPQHDIASGELVGAEALLRWQHPERGLLSPGAFIDAVHASDLSDDVAVHILRAAFRQAAEWARAGRPLRVGVNLSPSLFLLDLPALVQRELAAAGLDPQWIDLEVTENVLLRDVDAIKVMLANLRGLGVGVAFDDFGTGYASLTHLRSLPINCVKIDRGFTADVGVDPPAAAIVSGIIQMAAALDMRVIAEGIEKPETLQILRLLGCHEGQGYHYGRPQPAAELERRLAPRPRAA